MMGASEDNHSHHHHHDAHGEVTSITLRRTTPVRAAALPLLLETLAEVYGPKLLRIKGLAAIAEAPERPAVIHGVQHVFHPMEWLDAWPDDDRTTRLTLIGEGLMAGWPDILLDFLDEESGLAMS
jgi:G3E family GTPase